MDAARHPSGVLGFSTPAGYDLTPGSYAGICSTQCSNGGGGDCSYIAPCDGSVGNTQHTVTVWLDNLELENAAIAILGDDYHDP